MPELDLAAELLHRMRSSDTKDVVHREADIRIGLDLALAIESRLDIHLNRCSRTHYRDLFACYHRAIAPPRPPMRDSVYVDVGCGAVNPYGFLFMLLMLGVRRGFAIDLDECEDASSSLKALADIAGMALVDPQSIYGDYPVTRAELLQNLTGFDLARLRAGDPTGLDPGRLVYRRESVYSLSLESESADVVISNSFLEHVDRPEQAIAEFARITRPGGMGIHVIDGRDHRSYHDPKIHKLDFLEDMSGSEIVHSSNRVRPFQFVRLFERHGFDVSEFVPFETLTVDAARRARFAEPYRSLPEQELAVTLARVVVRRR